MDEVMKIAKMGSWEYDVLLDEFTFNDLFYSIFGTNAKREGGYKMSPADYAKKFVHPDDRAVVGIEIKKSLETTDSNFQAHLDHRIIRADGTTGYIAVYIRIGKDSQGKTVKAYGINQDISEREELRQKLDIKINELEKINRFMVDRELVMINLKKEIASLKGK